jgi:short-subunit dehydrogenase
MANAVRFMETDILVNNAGIGEGGPIAEILLDLVRKDFEVTVFALLAPTQRIAGKWVLAETPGKIVVVSWSKSYR